MKSVSAVIRNPTSRSLLQLPQLCSEPVRSNFATEHLGINISTECESNTVGAHLYVRKGKTVMENITGQPYEQVTVGEW
jgi:hypothetical protein